MAVMISLKITPIKKMGSVALLWRDEVGKGFVPASPIGLALCRILCYKCLLAIHGLFMIQLAYMLTGERLSVIGHPAGGVGHELRNPLSAIKSGC